MEHLIKYVPSLVYRSPLMVLYAVLFLDTLMSVKGQQRNASSPMLITLPGIVRVASLKQLENATLSIVVRLSERVMLFNEWHVANAASPIYVTLLHRVTLVID